MFYHVSFLFDYEGFSQEAKPLGVFIEKGDLSQLNDKISSITQVTSDEEFILRNYGFGESIKEIKPLAIRDEAQFLSSEIGKRFCILLSQYLTPFPIQIGFNWRSLVSVLESAKWPKEEIDALIFGFPIGRLVSEKAKGAMQIDTVTHSDPYWRWIRPLYSFNQGGWIGKEECNRLYEKLGLFESITGIGAQDLGEGKISVNIVSKARKLLLEAINKQKGLYMIILWDWEDGS